MWSHTSVLHLIRKMNQCRLGWWLFNIPGQIPMGVSHYLLGSWCIPGLGCSQLGRYVVLLDDMGSGTSWLYHQGALSATHRTTRGVDRLLMVQRASMLFVSARGEPRF